MPILIPKASSNKPKTNPKLPDKPSEPSDADDVIPFIDKLSVIIKPANADDAHDMYHAMKTAFSAKSLYEPVFFNPNGGFKESKQIVLEGFKQKPLIQYLYYNETVEKIRLEFNPRKLGVEGMKALNANLMILMDEGWGYVVDYGHITRIDIAFDLPGKRPEDFLLLKDIAVTSRTWSRQGEVQSIALGKGSGNQSAVYSVKAKRLNKGQPWDGSARTRIEKRIKKPSVSGLKYLADLPNPFVDLSIVPCMPGPPSANGKPPNELAKREWSRFMDSVKVRSVNPALALIPEDRRAKYRKHLKANALPWWDPEKIWINWPKALEVLKI
jgi:hypothetical protein